MQSQVQDIKCTLDMYIYVYVHTGTLYIHVSVHFAYGHTHTYMYMYIPVHFHTVSFYVLCTSHQLRDRYVMRSFSVSISCLCVLRGHLLGGHGASTVVRDRGEVELCEVPQLVLLGGGGESVRKGQGRGREGGRKGEGREGEGREGGRKGVDGRERGKAGSRRITDLWNGIRTFSIVVFNSSISP